MKLPFKQYDRSYCQPATCRPFHISISRSHQSPAIDSYCTHNSVVLHSSAASTIASRLAATLYFHRRRIPAATTPGPANHHEASPLLTRSNCYWTPEADVSESEAEDIGTWWLTAFTLFASMRTSSRAIARKPGKALVATVVLPGTAVITGLRSCLCRTTG